MKNTIINILILVLIFNIMMIVFPEGKTQKYCRLIIKIYMIIYIFNNLFFENITLIEDFMLYVPEHNIGYEREIIIKNVNKEFIDSINEANFEHEDVVKDIVLNFTDDMNIKALVTVNKYLNSHETNKLKLDIAAAFNISESDVEIDF